NYLQLQPRSLILHLLYLFHILLVHAGQIVGHYDVLLGKRLLPYVLVGQYEPLHVHWQWPQQLFFTLGEGDDRARLVVLRRLGRLP
ncbi:hypothetical protein PFISCL1PPCAC_22614, partial [Pristionchus fissidentatus]